MDPAYGSHYRALYEQHWWWRARERYLLGWLRRLRPPAGFGRILDVGCGDGLLFAALAPFGEVEGVEADASLVTDEGRARGRIHVQPFDRSFEPGHRFGLVLMLDVIEHFSDDRACLTRALELLEPGGLLIATVPSFQSLWTRHDEMNRHFRRYTKTTFRRLASDCGLRLEHDAYFFGWMVPLKLAVRAKEALFADVPRPPAVPAKPINQALLACSRLEQIITRHLPMPVGSSLFVAGRRPADLAGRP